MKNAAFLQLLLVTTTAVLAQPPSREGVEIHLEKNGSRLLDQSVQVVHKAEPTNGEFYDGRDNQKYGWIRFGKKKWMARNLDIPLGRSWCYENDESACLILGRLYSWNAARNACPKGWHLPNDAEWMSLLKFVQVNPQGYAKDTSKASSVPGWLKALVGVNNALDGVAGSLEEANDNLSDEKKEILDNSKIEKPEVAHLLKSVYGWYANGNGVDAFGFRALPAGKKGRNGSFEENGQFGYWWSAGGSHSSFPHVWGMGYSSKRIASGTSEHTPEGASIRCVED